MATKTLKPKILFFFIIATGLLNSCDLDQIESKYSDFESARKDGFFEKGWIPKQIVYNSMKDIYLIDNIDLNTFAFSFSVAKTDMNSINAQLTNKQIDFKNPDRLDIPKCWTKKAKTMKFDLLKLNELNNSIFIATDSNECRIYGFGSLKNNSYEFN